MPNEAVLFYTTNGMSLNNEVTHHGSYYYYKERKVKDKDQKEWDCSTVY